MTIDVTPTDGLGGGNGTTDGNSTNSVNGAVSGVNASTNAINLDILGTGWILKSSTYNTYSYAGGKSHNISSFAFTKMGPRTIFNISYNVSGQQSFFSQKFAPYVFDISVALQGNGLVNGDWKTRYYDTIKANMGDTTIKRIFSPWGKLQISGATTKSDKEGESVIVNDLFGSQLSYEATTISSTKTYRIYWPHKAGNWVSPIIPPGGAPPVPPPEISPAIIAWDNIVSCNIGCQDKVYSCSIQTCS